MSQRPDHEASAILTSTDASVEFCPNSRSPPADFRVISSDGVVFPVHKAILGQASDMFSDLFGNCDPPEPDSEPLKWDEPSFTIKHLLRYIYPIPNPTIKTLDDCITLLQAADKWQIDVAKRCLREELVRASFLEQEALKVYGFASDMDFSREKEVAFSKAKELDPFDPALRGQLAFLSAFDLLRIDHYRKGLPADYLTKSSLSAPPPTPVEFVRDELFDDPEADLLLTSSDLVPFRVHKQILAVSSPRVLKKLIADAEVKFRSEPTKDSLPVLSLPEEARVIQELLHHIYPSKSPEPQRTLADVMRLLQVAGKYDLPRAVSVLKSELVSEKHLNSRPLRIFGFSCSRLELGLQEERKAALKRSIRTDPLLHQVEEDFHDMHALDLVALAEARQKLVQFATNLKDVSFPTYWCNHGNPGTVQDLGEFLKEELRETPFSDVLRSARVISCFIGSTTHRGEWGSCTACFAENVKQHEETLEKMTQALDEFLESL